MDSFIDMIGQICWFAMFIAPIVSIIFYWKFGEYKKIYKIAVGLLVGCIFSLLFCIVATCILFRDGLGPT